MFLTGKSSWKLNPSFTVAFPGSNFFRVPNTPVSEFLILDVSRQIVLGFLSKYEGQNWTDPTPFTGLPFSYLLRKPSTLWRETSKIKNSETWERKKIGMLPWNSGLVLKMITRSETSTNQFGLAMNRPGSAAQSGSEMNRSGSLRTYLIMEYGEQTQRLLQFCLFHICWVSPVQSGSKRPRLNSETGVVGTRKIGTRECYRETREEFCRFMKLGTLVHHVHGYKTLPPIF